MNDTTKARILDYMKEHAETLLNNEVKDISKYSAEKIILAKHDASQFLKSYNETVKRLTLSTTRQ